MRKLVPADKRLHVLYDLHRDDAHQKTPDVAPNSGGLVRGNVELQHLPNRRSVMPLLAWKFAMLYAYVLLVGTVVADFIFTDMH